MFDCQFILVNIYKIASNIGWNCDIVHKFSFECLDSRFCVLKIIKISQNYKKLKQKMEITFIYIKKHLIKNVKIQWLLYQKPDFDWFPFFVFGKIDTEKIPYVEF